MNDTEQKQGWVLLTILCPKSELRPQFLSDIVGGSSRSWHLAQPVASLEELATDKKADGCGRIISLAFQDIARKEVEAGK